MSVPPLSFSPQLAPAWLPYYLLSPEFSQGTNSHQCQAVNSFLCLAHCTTQQQSTQLKTLSLKSPLQNPLEFSITHQPVPFSILSWVIFLNQTSDIYMLFRCNFWLCSTLSPTSHCNEISTNLCYSLLYTPCQK